MSSTRAVWRSLLTLVVVAAAFAFLAYTAHTNWVELNRHPWQVHLPMLALSITAHVAVLAWGVLVWSWVLRNFEGAGLDYPSLLRVWSLSNAARYIPGAVWQFLTAARLSRERGLPGVLALTSMLLHVGFSLLAAVLVASYTLPLELLLGVAPPAAIALRAALTVAAVLSVHPALLNGVLRLVPRAMHRQVLAWNGGWATGLLLLALSCFSWVIYGVAYWLFVGSLTPVGAELFAAFTGVNALSFVAGYVAVLAPGGIGVREAAMTLLLTPVLPAGVAAVVAIAARLWSIAAELVLVAFGLAIARRAVARADLEPS